MTFLHTIVFQMGTCKGFLGVGVSTFVIAQPVVTAVKVDTRSVYFVVASCHDDPVYCCPNDCLSITATLH